MNTWTEGLIARGLDRDVALLATKSNKPSPQRQFQSSWKQVERYFARNHLKLEDVSVASFAKIWPGIFWMKALLLVLFEPLLCLY